MTAVGKHYMRQNDEGTTKLESITCVTTTRVLQNDSCWKALYDSEQREYYKMKAVGKHFMRRNQEGATKYESITCVRTMRVLQNMKALHASEP